MRRPLCLAGLAFVAALIIGIAGNPNRAETYGQWDGETVTVAGVVDWKEYKISRGEKVLAVSLTHVTMLEPNQASDLMQAIAESNEIPSKQLSTKIFRKSRTKQIEGLLCYMKGKDVPDMGSYAVMEGKFSAFSHATNPGEFDAANYYRIMGQQGRVMQCTCLMQGGRSDRLKEGLYRLREYLALLINACCPEEDASVMRAMLLGEKGTLDREIKNLYQQNGIIHILSISGLHLSILGMGLYRFLKKIRVPTLVNIILSAAIMYCYGTMTGMGISVVRALIMFFFHLGAGLFGRTYDMLTAMTVAALSILIQQPLYLTHSGFLFSFGAICGIGLLLPAASENMLWNNRFLTMLFSGILISVATLPVYLVFYYEFPPYSVLLNLIVIPCMTFVLLSGLAMLAAAACYLPIGRYAAIPGSLILSFYEKCCELFIKLPNHKWNPGCPQTWQVVLFVLLLAGLVLWNRKLTKIQFWQGILLALMALTIRRYGGLEITVVDVGQGDCIYVADDRDGHYLIDGGSASKSDTAQYQILPFLKYKGADRLDAVFVTHPDSDHISGIRELLDGYQENGIEIGTLIMPDVSEGSKTDEYRSLVMQAEKEGVSVRFIHAGETIQNGKLMLTCLHPDADYANEDTNAYSTVLYLTYGKFSALFTGDLEGEGERLVAERIREIQAKSRSGVTFLKVAHHGSKNSTGTGFLNVVRPVISVISCGRDNRYGHPHEELLERLEDCGTAVYRTPESGAVSVYVRNGRVRVEEYVREQETKIAKERKE